MSIKVIEGERGYIVQIDGQTTYYDSDKERTDKYVKAAEFCVGKPICADCGHSLVHHLYPYTTKIRAYVPGVRTTSFAFGYSGEDACTWSAGCWDGGCNCRGYRPNNSWISFLKTKWRTFRGKATRTRRVRD